MASPSAMSVASPVAGPSRPSAGKRHTCDYEGCGKSYTKPAKLAQHVRSHTGERPFVCTEAGCGASYMRNEHLKAHQRQHLDPKEKPFKCTHESCDLAFWTSSQLKNHLQACHTDDADLTGANGQSGYPCTEPGCDKSFNKRKNLRLHIRQDHSGYVSESQDQESATMRPFACTHSGCALRFSTNAKRKLHLKTHQPGRYTCAMEHAESQNTAESESTGHMYTFPTWSALQAHIKAAHPRACSWPGCDKQFSRQDSLRAHYRRHEARKLRLELELRTIEMSQEAQLNYRRAGLTDESDASSDEGSDFEASSRDAQISPAHQSTISPPLPSEEQLILQAAQLSTRRPRRGGIFKDLHSASQSAASTASVSDDGTTTRRSGTTATGITSADVSLPITCSWNGCPKTYSSKGALSVHVRTVHLGDKPFECNGCGKRFAHKHLVTRHRRVCTEQSSVESAPETSRLRFSTTLDDGDDIAQADQGANSNEHSTGLASPQTSSQQNEIRTKLLDLLTGSGYSSSTLPSKSLKRAAAGTHESESAHPQKRTTRDRVFDCPWHSIQARLVSDSHVDPELQLDDGVPDIALSTAVSASPPCGFRFKRIYDLRRHLQAHHGLALEDREIKAWFKLEESTVHAI